jgi:hypothetical protein
MTRLRAILRHRRGATSAEFALVLPIAILFLFGIIDVGRYAWALNRLEKSVQAGARYAVATQIIPQGLNEKDFTGFDCGGATITAGDPIACKEALGTITCTKSGGTVSCTCVESTLGAASCDGVIGSPNTAAFDNIVSRMRVIEAGIGESNVTVRYSGSGIGYAGDPATDDVGNPLSDVAPIVTVAIESLDLRLLLLLGGEVTLPSFNYSLTLEDGDGAIAY